ncbi:hypothetical protein PoB_000136800 [Plakobranchus ocellatus]|uniref:Uncharacterized protein n=1 Tax=Plakobranchus ocellatus TaxID=259542 RepID=A0AAV3XX82_9GAST|nr:hypothetical protein PoB_000136800 [Plakobranchus ocellatus]
MAAKYRSAYPDISLAREEISISNIAAGPTGKDRDARPTIRDTWMRTIEIAKCLKDLNPVIHSDVGETQVPDEQSRQEWMYPRDRKNENFLGRGRQSDYNRHDNCGTDSPYQARYQRENRQVQKAFW